MAYRHFPGKTKEWLESKLSEVVDEMVSGKRLTGWGDGSANATKHSFGNLHPERLRDMLLEDLNALDPANYPQDMLKVKATTAVFIDP